MSRERRAQRSARWYIAMAAASALSGRVDHLGDRNEPGARRALRAFVSPHALGQILVVLEPVTEDDTVGCDLVLARKRVMGAPTGFENR